MSGAAGAAAEEPQQLSCTYTPAQVLCCICGAITPPNPRNKCLSCLQEELDVSSQVCRTFVVDHCRQCGRFKDAQGKWLPCEIESRELLALCLKKIRGLKSLAKIVDCRWVFTEAHSNKLILRITARADVLENKAQVEQAFNVQGLIHNTQCDECKKAFTPHAGWGARVQVRQRCEHKRTFLFLEQLVLQQQHILEKLLRAVQSKDGLDFHFPNKQAAAAFVAFCCSRFPCSTRSSKQLISHDCYSNTYFYKHTVYVELAPICKDDLVFIPAKKAKETFGGFASLSLCCRVGSSLTLVDPFTARSLDLSAEVYFRDSYLPLCTRKHLSYFLILSVTPLPQHQQPHHHPSKKQQQQQQKQQQQQLQQQQQAAAAADDAMAVDSSKAAAASDATARTNSSSSSSSSGFLLAEIELLRCSASGIAEGEPIITRSHLGHLLQAGDFAAGYDFQRINLSGFADACVERDLHWPQTSSSSSSSSSSGKGRPEQQGLAAAPWEVMLVKKHFPFRKAGRRRQWVLRSLQKQDDDGMMEEEEVGSVRGGSGHAPASRGTDTRKRRGGAARKGAAAASDDEDLEQFKRDLEEDPELRKQVAIYKDPRAFTKTSMGAAKIRVSNKKQQQQQQQQQQRRREANKARKVAEAQEERQRQQRAEEDGNSQWETDEEEEEEETESGAGAAPQIDLSELLDCLSLDDLKPVTPGQGVSPEDAQQPANAEAASDAESDSL
ncbi:hypothetical protein Emed_003949 [Eimeria media]